MATTSEKFQEIANAIKNKTVRNGSNSGTVLTDKQYKIIANDFATQISFIDRLRPMTLYPDGLDNGYLGVLAARTASTYHYARLSGADVFDYVQESDNVFNTRTNPENVNYLSARVRDEHGRCLVDCSSFVGLVLRGIPYDNSPFSLYKDANSRWYPGAAKGKGGLLDMYGDAGWEFNVLDKQPADEFRNFGFNGYSTIRGAGDQAQFFYKYGYVIFDQQRDGKPSEYLDGKLVDLLKPGDLIFYAQYEKDEDGKMVYPNWSKSFNLANDRFRSIHHVSIVAERTDMYFHSTGSDSNEENELTIIYDDFTDRLDEIGLICRPDYSHGNLSTEVPKKINLLCHPWTFSYNMSATIGGVSIRKSGENGSVLKLSGQVSDEYSATTIDLKGDPDNKYDRLHLTAGTYKLSGMENSPYETTNVALQLRRYVDSAQTLEIIARCYAGNNPTFTLTEDADVYVRLYIAKGYVLDFDITPTLVRVP